MNIKMFKNGWREYNKIKEDKDMTPPTDVLVMSDGLFITSEDKEAVKEYINKLQAKYECFASSPIAEEYAWYQSLLRERSAEGASYESLASINEQIRKVQQEAEKLGIKL